MTFWDSLMTWLWVAWLIAVPALICIWALSSPGSMAEYRAACTERGGQVVWNGRHLECMK